MSQELASGTAQTDWARCDDCGRPYQPYNRRKKAQRFCSAECRTRDWRRNHPSIGPTQTDIFGLVEGKRRAGKAERMLNRLRQGSATTWELMALGGAGFSSRLNELRTGKHDGVKHKITATEHGDHATYDLEGA